MFREEYKNIFPSKTHPLSQDYHNTITIISLCSLRESGHSPVFTTENPQSRRENSTRGVPLMYLDLIWWELEVDRNGVLVFLIVIVVFHTISSVDGVV